MRPAALAFLDVPPAPAGLEDVGARAWRTLAAKLLAARGALTEEDLAQVRIAALSFQLYTLVRTARAGAEGGGDLGLEDTERRMRCSVRRALAKLGVPVLRSDGPAVGEDPLLARAFDPCAVLIVGREG